jgi:hypothetical protein
MVKHDTVKYPFEKVKLVMHPRHSFEKVCINDKTYKENIGNFKTVLKGIETEASKGWIK